MSPFWKRKPSRQEQSDLRAASTGLVTLDEMKELHYLDSQVYYRCYTDAEFERWKELSRRADLAMQELERGGKVDER